MAEIYRVTNYGNTRKLPYLGDYYELTKNCTIETDDEKLAAALGQFEFIDVETIKQPKSKKKISKKKVFKKKRKLIIKGKKRTVRKKLPKKKVTTKNKHKKIKQC